MPDTVLGTGDRAGSEKDTGSYPHEDYVLEKPRRHADMRNKTN